MAKSRGKIRYNVSRLRGRKPGASGRRFCIVWINRMVNKQVEKQISELREEILHMHLEMRVQMAAELREHLGEALVTQTRDTPEPYSASDTGEMETRQLKDKEGKEESLSKEELNSNHSDTRSYEMPYPNRIPPKPDQGPRIFSNISRECDSVNRDIRDAEIKHLPGEDHGASQQVQRGQIFPSGDPAVLDGCKLTKKSEEKKGPKTPVQMFTVGKEESVGDKANAQDDLLMKAQWKEWLDKQEMQGNKRHEHQKKDQQRSMGPYAAERQMTTGKKSGQTGTMKKITTYLTELFNPSETSKWELLEEED